MMTLDEYLTAPCKRLSIPYWKAKNLVMPDGISVVHDSLFSPKTHRGCHDERYFRLMHDLNHIGDAEPSGYVIRTASQEDIGLITSIINSSYTDLHVSESQIAGYMSSPTYRPSLWVLVEEIASGNHVGCGIADFDAESGEMSLEWIQVLPAFRRRNIGQMIVNELLRRGKSFARFATVSGRVDDPVSPERLYRKCGFTETIYGTY